MIALITNNTYVFSFALQRETHGIMVDRTGILGAKFLLLLREHHRHKRSLETTDDVRRKRYKERDREGKRRMIAVVWAYMTLRRSGLENRIYFFHVF